MTVNLALDNFDEYRLLLVRAGSHAIWAEFQNRTMRLPRVSVLKRRRLAEQLQQLAELRWRLRVIVLDVLPLRRGAPQSVLVDLVSSESPLDLVPVGLDDLPVEELNREERKILRSVLAGTEQERGPFSHAGWIHAATEWLQSEVGHNAQVVKDIRQFNASGTFSLVRFDGLTGERFWLKATGSPNAHEFHVTRELADLCPESLPRILAMRSDWNAWLMADGGEVNSVLDVSMLKQATVTMAELQKKTIGFTDRFLNVGVADQRLVILQNHLPKLMDYLREAMTKQTSNRAIRLDATDLNRLETVLHAACDCMEALKIPDTLVHSDANSGNILFAKSRCVFTDWCEARVTNPFLGYEYLSLLGVDLSAGQLLELREAYKECWLDRLRPTQIDQAFLLAPSLAALACLYGRGTWLSSPERNEPRYEIYARSLARRMHRSIQAASLSDVVLCR